MKSFRVGEYRIDPSLNQIVREGDPDVVVRLEPRAMEVLSYLAERAGEVVDKESVIRDVWNGAFVTNEVLTNAVWELRRAFGDDAKSSAFIQTIPKRGYRLVAPVSGIEETARPRGSIPRWALALLLLAVAVALLFGIPRSTPRPDPVRRLLVEAPEPLGPVYLPTAALSPDATRIVYAAPSGLYLRKMDRWKPSLIPGTEGAEGPFFSPDGTEVGFFSEGRIRTVSLDDGSRPSVVSEVGAPRGAAWGSDGWIYFSAGSEGGLLRARAHGSERESVTELDESAGEWTHRWPEVLPGARGVLFTVAKGSLESFDDAEIHAFDLKTRERHVVVERGSFPRYLSGYLLYVRGGEIFAVPFDVSRLHTSGPAKAVLEDVKLYPINGSAQLSVSSEGSLLYVPEGEEAQHELSFLDRDGHRSSVLRDDRLLYDPVLSPDGSRIVVSRVTAGNSDLWIYDLDRKTMTRLTTTPGEEEHPVVSPEARELAYDYSLSGGFQIFARSADGSGEAQPLSGKTFNQRPESFSPDGRTLVFTEENPKTGFDLWTLDLEGEGERQPLLVTPFDERHARVSPDGEKLAYSSNDSGRFEIYVTTFPQLGPKLQLSVDGGEHPVWTKGGREILFLGPQGIMAVAVAGLSAERPEKLFDWSPSPRSLEGAYRKHFDATSDGERLLVVESPPDPEFHRLHVVSGFASELGTEPRSKP